MSKGAGLGARYYVGGYDISGDTQSLDAINGGTKTLPGTDITQSGQARLFGLRDGNLDFTVFFDKTGAHVPLSSLPTGNTIGTFLAPPVAVGGAAASCNGKQIDYNPSRGADGSLLLKTQIQASPFGLEWGQALTAGTRTDATATNGADYDQGASQAWGAQAYLQAIALTGTTATVTIQQSPDNTTWNTLLAFAAATSAPQVQRIATAAQSFTATNASPAVFTVGTAIANGTPVALSGSSLPAGFTAGTTYFAVAASGLTFELSATSGGSAINSTSAGSGTVTPVVQRFLRAITAGTFTSFSFVTMININLVAVSF